MKAPLIFLFVLGHLGSLTVCMQQPQGPKSQSLYEYCEIGHLQKDIQPLYKDAKNLIAQAVIGRAGWWYLDKQLHQEHVSASSVSFDSQDELLAIGYELLGVNVWNAQDKVIWSKHERLEGEIGFCADITFKPHTKTLCMVSGSQCVSGWNVVDGSREAITAARKTIIKNDALFNHFGFNSDGTRIVTSTRNAVELWDAAGTKIAVAPHVFKGILALSFSHDSSLVAISSDCSFYLWDITKKTIVKCTYEDLSGVRVAKFHPRKHLLVSLCPHKKAEGSDKGLNAIWDFDNPKAAALQEPTYLCEDSCSKQALSLCFHPSKDIFAIGFLEHGILLLNLKGQRLMRIDYACQNPHSNRFTNMYDITFNHEGNVLAAARKDPVAVLWRQFKQPTLEQVLFRLALKKYYITCIAAQKTPDYKWVSDEGMVPWMAETLNIKQDELTPIWDSMTLSMKNAIIRTLYSRKEEIPYTKKKKKIPDELI